MFLHRVKRNWEPYHKTTIIVLAFAALRFFVEDVLGYPPLNAFAVLTLGAAVVVVTILWALAKTFSELAAAYWKQLCTFTVALRKFCRDYWSSSAAV